MSALKSLSDYGYNFQLKVINSLLKERTFLLNIRDIIEVEYFDHIGDKWIVENILNYFDQFHTTPSLEYFKIEVKKVENEILQVAIKEQLKSIFTTLNEDKEWVEQEFNTFCVNQKLKKALLDSVDLLNIGEFEEIRHTIENALKAGQDKNIGLEYIKDIETRYTKSKRVPIPTPWEIINKLLAGGLGGGDYGIFYGGPGGGKSWSLVAIGAFALALGYKVIHYTLELGEDYVGKRYDACLTKISVDEIDEHVEQLKDFLKKYENNLIIKEFPMKATKLSNIKSHIQKCKDLGFNADLVIIDYVDLLKPPTVRKDAKAEIDDLHYGTKGLAKELNIPIWSVSQVNRAGAKDDVVEGDKAAGSYDKLMVADFSMSQSRNRKDKVKGKGRWHIMKNRYGSDGQTYDMEINIKTGEFIILGEYDEEEEYRKEEPKQPYNQIQKEEKEILLEKFHSFKIE